MQINFSLEDIGSTLEALPISVAVLKVCEHDTFRLVFMSDEMAKIYNVNRDESVGRFVDEFRFPPAVKAHLNGLYIKCRDSGQVVTAEEEMTRPDGKVIWTSRTLVPLLIDNEVKALLITLADSTELLLARKALTSSLSTLAGGFVHICAWCKSVNVGKAWMPLDEIVKSTRHSEGSSHCPDCKP